MKNNIKIYSLIMLCTALFWSCGDDDSVSPIDKIVVEESTDPLDVYLKETFTDPYGLFVRYKWNSNFVDLNRFVTPPEKEQVKPVMDFINNIWIKPFIEGDPNGLQFVRENMPPEIILLGSPIFNVDGTRTLGTADNGVRITVAEIERFENDAKAWQFQVANTIQHEFTHIVNQRKNIPNEYRNVTPFSYTTTSWVNVSNSEAIERGMVSPYGTSSLTEDFAEMVSVLLTISEEEFMDTYSSSDDIMTKRTIAIEYYKSFDIDILAVRDVLLTYL